jgi:hypothetical protein
MDKINPLAMTLVLSMVAALAVMVWYVFPKECRGLGQMLASYCRLHWRRVIGALLIIGAFAVVPAQNALVLVLGLPIAFYAWHWWRTNHRAGQDDSVTSDTHTCPSCGSKMIPIAGKGLPYRCSSDFCARVVTLR